MPKEFLRKSWWVNFSIIFGLLLLLLSLLLRILLRLRLLRAHRGRGLCRCCALAAAAISALVEGATKLRIAISCSCC